MVELGRACVLRWRHWAYKCCDLVVLPGCVAVGWGVAMRLCYETVMGSKEVGQHALCPPCPTLQKRTRVNPWMPGGGGGVAICN